jgi:hypothetical protein
LIYVGQKGEVNQLCEIGCIGCSHEKQKVQPKESAK